MLLFFNLGQILQITDTESFLIVKADGLKGAQGRNYISYISVVLWGNQDCFYHIY